MDRGAWWATAFESQRVRHYGSNLAHMHASTFQCSYILYSGQQRVISPVPPPSGQHLEFFF